MRRILKFLTSKAMICIPLALLQVGVLFVIFYRVADIYQFLPVFNVLSIILAIYIINRFEDPSYKIAWCCLILAVPVVGVPLYLLAGNRKIPRKLIDGTIRAAMKTNGFLDGEGIQDTEQLSEENRIRFEYGKDRLGFPVYDKTSCRYYKSGEDWFPDYLAELEKAEKFIFMEFYIVDQGSCLDELTEILERKVSEGVEVVLIYDDFGCVTMPRKFWKKLAEKGIKAYPFNKVRPAFIIQMNNRDHRKITIIDNRTAFVGGVNIADEYVNRISRFGYWKDSALKLTGDAVWSLTAMFLGMYTNVRDDEGEIDYAKYRLTYDSQGDGGKYQPYSDSPTDDETAALYYHMNMVNQAEKYIYMDTPYLILNTPMQSSLMLAAKNGVDVRIMTPYIPDKILVNQITKANYLPLLQSGVRIYEYLPGFDHSKNFVSDDKTAIIGSANMDYRSYFLHFENGVLMADTDEILKIRDDFLTAAQAAKEITIADVKKTILPVRIVRAVLNLFIPLV